VYRSDDPPIKKIAIEVASGSFLDGIPVEIRICDDHAPELRADVQVVVQVGYRRIADRPESPFGITSKDETYTLSVARGCVTLPPFQPTQPGTYEIIVTLLDPPSAPSAFAQIHVAPLKYTVSDVRTSD
jgi:hypothetical protein